MKIRGKLFLMNLVALAGFIAISLGTIFSMTDMRKLNELARDGLALKGEFSVFATRGMDLHVTANLKDSYDRWSEQRKLFGSLYEKFAGSRYLLSIPGSKEKIESLAFLWANAQTKMDDISAKIEDLLARHGSGGSFVPGLMMGFDRTGDSAFAFTLAGINNLSTTIASTIEPALSELVALASAEAGASEGALIRLIVAMAVVVSIASFALSTAFGRRLGKRIQRIASSMGSLDSKDFTIRLDEGGKDELGDIAAAMNGFIGDFSRIIDGVKTTAEAAIDQRNEVASATIESSASVTEMTANISSIGSSIRSLVENLGASNRMVRDITESVDSLVARIQAQSTLIQRSTASIEEMNASIGNVATIASRREDAARELVEVTKNGGAMVDDTNLRIREIVGEIGEIGEIVGIINGISEMTDLLSMNAAIEAAHAGQAGRGFSVVAEEIRKLADSTKENSSRIKAMIEAISDKIVRVLEKSESSKSGFDEVAKEVNSTSLAMSEISTSMKELSAGSKEIMNATEELSGIAAKVSGEASRIHSSTDGILSGIKSIEEISEVVRTGILEIEVGTKEMDSAMASVSELEMRSSESIARLSAEVADFKTSGAELQALEPETEGAGTGDSGREASK